MVERRSQWYRFHWLPRARLALGWVLAWAITSLNKTYMPLPPKKWHILQYTLWEINIAMENGHLWWIYQRVSLNILEYLGADISRQVWQWCFQATPRDQVRIRHFFVAPGQPRRLEASGTEGMQQIGRHLPGQWMPRDAKGAPERRLQQWKWYTLIN